MAYRRTERAARLADLEAQLIEPASSDHRKPRTLEDVCAEHGLDGAEKRRLANCLHVYLSGPGPGEQQKWLAGEARWVDCRFIHGPGVCGADCLSEGELPCIDGASGLSEGGQDMVEPATPVEPQHDEERLGPPQHDEERRDIFSPRFFPFGGWDEEQTRANQAAWPG